jgi:hypothetical protein
MKRTASTISLVACLCLAGPLPGADTPLVVELWPGRVPDEPGTIGHGWLMAGPPAGVAGVTQGRWISCPFWAKAMTPCLSRLRASRSNRSELICRSSSRVDQRALTASRS